MMRVRLGLMFGMQLLAVVCFAQATAPDRSLTLSLGGLGGTTRQPPRGWTGGTWADNAHTFAYSFSYREQLRGALSGAVTYLNQGHYDDGHRSLHHSRDDFQVELFVGKRPAGGRLELRIGGGGAYYSETDRVSQESNVFLNHQGFGAVVTGAVDFDISNRLFVEGRVHRHFVLNRYASTNVLMGMGFRLREKLVDQGDKATRQAIALTYGLGRLNSTKSESLKHAFQAAYEIELSTQFSAAFAYLEEGAAPELNRKGVVLQGAVRRSLGGPFVAGIALGPYVNVDKSDFFGRKGRISADALLTIFMDVAVSRHTALTLSAGRPRSLSTLKGKPMTDVILGGLKFRF